MKMRTGRRGFIVTVAGVCLTLSAGAVLEGEFARFEGPRYHVMGNHDMQGVTRTEPNGATFAGGIS